MDLVHIGFKVDAKGLKEANNEVDSLLGKVDQIGTKGKKSASEFENSQKKVSKEVDKTSKALEKQRLIGEYLGKGLDKSTASAIASFRQLGGTTSQVNQLMSAFSNNKGLIETQKGLEKLSKEQEKQAEAVKATLAGYEKLSGKSLGGGVLDQIEKQNKSLLDMRKHYQGIESSQSKQNKLVAETVSGYEKLSSKSLGGGILDAVEKQNKGVQDLNNYYKQLEAEQAKIAKTQQQAIEKQLNAQKNINAERAKALQIEQLRAEYIAQGFGKTDAGKLASLEVSGASTADLEKRAEAIRNNSKALSELNPKTVVATESNNKLLASIKGIAAYALLSTAIYGVITATSSLAVATVQMADEYTSIQNRMKLYIKDVGEVGRVNAQLAQMSIENNVGLRETATLFSRLLPSMQRIGANTSAVISVVDAFGKSMRIGGATAMEAASATIQFSQAMASGKLAGDEFRSISEASQRFLKAIADGSGIAAEKLKEMSAAGLLTTEVISKALLKEYPKLIEENKKLGITLEQGANAIKTGFLVAIGEFNEGAKVTQYFGEMMADLAQKLFKAAQGAREFGQDVKQWFTDNANTINLVVEAFKVLATVIIARYVVAMGLAVKESIRYQAKLVTMAAQQANVTRSSLIMSSAITSVGTAMRGALAFFGGWVGLALTVASATAAYLSFNSASEATAESFRQEGESLTATINKYKELAKVKQQAVLDKEIANLEELNKQYDESKTKLVTNVLNLSRHNDMTQAQAKSMSALALAYKNGDISLDKLVSTVSQSGYVSNESKVKTRGFAEAVVDAGEKAGLSKDLIEAMRKALASSGEQAKIAKTGVDSFTKGLDDQAKKLRETTALAKRYGLEIASATKLQEQLSSRFGAKETELPLRKQYYDKKAQEALARGDTTTANNWTKASLSVQAQQNSLLKQKNQIIAQTVKGLKEVEAAQKEQSDYTESLRKAEKVSEKAGNKKEEVNNYPEQIRELERVVSLLEKGAGLEVAKIASQKEYVKWYGSNLDVARQIVAIDERRLALEKSIADAKKRNETSKTLKEQISSYAEIAKFVNEGFTVAVAQQAINDGFKYSAEGIAHANNLVLKSLNDQIGASLDELNLQQDIRDFVKGGDSIERATANAIIYRNKHLNETLVSKTAELALTKEQVVVEQSRVAYEQEINALKNQANDLALTQGSNLADITLKYKGIGIEEAKSLKTKQDIVSKLTEYNELLGKQRTLAYDIENVNFDVFGDFGNPFQSALEGLNSLLFGMDDLKNKYANMYSDLDARIAKEQEGTVAQEALLTQKANLEMMYIEDSKKARDQAITSGLALSKSFFKEESKGYKAISTLEKVYQASKIAFALWEKKDVIAFNALKLQAYVTDTLGFTTGAYAKIVAQEALNIAQAKGGVAAAANAPPPVGFASAAAMIALLAGIGISLGGSSASGSFAATNEGTVFGDSEAKSASIANSIDLLSENSDLMLPLTSAMLKSLRNIESSIGGVTNLILRQATSGSGFSINEGFSQNSIGKLLSNPSVGSLGGILGGGALGATFGVSTLMSGLGMGAMGALAIAGPIGLAVGALLGPILGKALGGLFGSKTTIKGQGLFGSAQKLGDILTEGFDLVEYIDVQVKKKSFGITTSTKNSTRYAAADEALTQQFSLIFTGFYDSILSATDILGADTNSVKTKLENAIVDIGKIDLKGLTGDEIQEKLEAVFGAAADKLAQVGFAGLEDFQQVGEGYYETLIRVAGAVEEASYWTSLLNVATVDYTDVLNKQGDVAAEIVRQSVLLNDTTKDISGGFYDLVNNFDGTAEELTDFVMTLQDLQDQLFMTGKNADYLTSAMILGAGDIDKLSSGLDAYFEMLSPAEQAAELTRRLTNEFAIFGKELPADVKAFRALVSSIDISTEAGQKLYGQIIALAPEFNDLQDAIESANSEVNALVQSLRDLAEQARQARGETEQPSNLDYTRAMFEYTAMLAMQGDTQAAEELTSLGTDLMNLSKQYSVDGSEYARDLAMIQRAATVSADVQEAGLGYTSSTLSTTLSGGSVTPTVPTTSTSTDAKLDALREDLNAALLAIAKYTQSTASKLENWDDGNRVMVGVIQEAGDPKVPVTTA